MKHPNADVITAWVMGAELEVQSPTTDEWMPVPAATDLGQGRQFLEPHPLHPDYDYMTYRVKSVA